MAYYQQLKQPTKELYSTAKQKSGLLTPEIKTGMGKLFSGFKTLTTPPTPTIAPKVSTQGYSNTIDTDAAENKRLAGLQPPTTLTTPTQTPSNFTPNYDFSNYSTSLTNYLNSLKAPTPEQEIAKQKQYYELLKQQYDPQVAATTAVYGDILARQQEQSKGAIGQSRAMVSAAGLAGTPMGQAQVQRTAERQANIEKAIDMEKGAKIQQILGEVRTLSQKEAERDTLDRMKYADKALEVQKEIITQAKQNLFDLAKTGYGWDANAKQLAEMAGYTGDLAEVLYKANQPTGVDWEKVTLKDGSVMLYGENKGTGQFEKKIIRPDQPEGYEWTLINGQEYYVPEGNKEGDLTGAIKKVSEEDKDFAQWKRKEDYSASLKPKGGSSLTPNQKIDAEMSLYGKVQAATKLQQEVIRNMNGINTLWSNYRTQGGKMNKNAISQAIITSYGKILDPGSVVRESEYARTPEGVALVDKAEGFLEKMQKGGAGLTDKNLQEFVDAINLLGKNAQSEINQQINIVKKYGEQYGLDTSMIEGKYVNQSNQSTENNPLGI